MHFPYNDTLIVTMLIGNCRVSKVLVNRGSFVNILYRGAHILYRGALDRMEDSQEAARVLINCQTQSHLYGFDGNEMRSPGTISLPVRADPYIVIT